MMDSFQALQVISQRRGDAIVVTTMTANPEWSQLSKNPDLDMPLIGAMGKASSLGLGLALALPGKKVIVLDGDGSLLMNLGSLVTIAHMAPANLIHFVLDNGVYRTTGGQPIPNVDKFSFAAMARDAGYPNACEFDTLENLGNSIEDVLNQSGPTFICLKVAPSTERPPFPFVRTGDILPQFRAAVQRFLQD